MQLLFKVCMPVFQLVSDGQVATGYAPYCMFETCKQEQSVWYRRRRDSFVEGQIGGSTFKLAKLARLREAVAAVCQCDASQEGGAARRWQGRQFRTPHRGK